MKTNIMVLDTETTGLPILRSYNNYHCPSFTQYYNNSRIIEIGYIIYSETGEEILKRNFLIKPKNFEIKNSDIHGITNEMVNTDGININDMFMFFEDDLKTVKTMVCHNIKFDYNVLLSECYRYKKYILIDKIKNLDKECTMLMGKVFLKQKKNPKLQILYSHFNKDIEIIQTHRALDDSIMCANCYFNIKNNSEL
jgi:DNA polymerase III epsilon subunit-like protein